MKARTIKRQRRGHVYRHGKGYAVRWMMDGKVYCRALRDAEGKPITAKRAADKAAAALLRSYTLTDESESIRALIGNLEGVKDELARIDAERNPGTRIGDGFAAFRAAENRPRTGPETLKQYCYQYEQLCKWMCKSHPEQVRMNEVTRETARAYAADMVRRGLSGNTINKHLNLFDLIWRVLAEPGKITVNPWTKESIARRRVQSGTGRRELTIPELKRIADAAEGELRTLLAVGMFTGLRLGDACRLDWSEVDLLRGCIVTAPRKTRETSGALVAIPLAPSLQRILESMPPEARAGYVMPGLAARYESDNRGLIKEIQAHFKRCGIPTTEPVEGRARPRLLAGFHSLRHSFITQAAMSGWPETLVRAIVGHSSGAVTRRYVHATVDAVKGLPALPDPLALPPPPAPRVKAIARPDPLPDWARELVKRIDGRTYSRIRELLLA